VSLLDGLVVPEISINLSPLIDKLPLAAPYRLQYIIRLRVFINTCFSILIFLPLSFSSITKHFKMVGKRKREESEPSEQTTDIESRRVASTDTEISPKDAAFLSYMVEIGLSARLAECVRQWYAVASNDDPYIALIAYPDRFMHFAAPTGDQMADLRASMHCQIRM
jgi:hypothetical protein